MPSGNLPVPHAESSHERYHDAMSEQMSPIAQVDWPLPRPSWREDVEDAYAAYRRDVSSSVARQLDVPMVMRYFDLQEMMARIFDELLAENTWLVENRSSSASHPHLVTFARLVTTSIRLANEIGATPMARVKLGLHHAQGKLAAEALERALNADTGKRDPEMEVIEVEADGDEVVMSW